MSQAGTTGALASGFRGASLGWRTGRRGHPIARRGRSVASCASEGRADDAAGEPHCELTPKKCVSRPRRIILIRHAESEGNVDETVYQVGTHLTPGTGWRHGWHRTPRVNANRFVSPTAQTARRAEGCWEDDEASENAGA